MPEQTRIVEIALDLDFAEFLLDNAGLILEAQALRSAGNLTEIHNPSDEQLARLLAFLNRMDIAYNITSSGSSPDDSNRRPRHSAP
jgi:hypothetical protein